MYIKPVIHNNFLDYEKGKVSVELMRLKSHFKSCYNTRAAMFTYSYTRGNSSLLNQSQVPPPKLFSLECHKRHDIASLITF